MSLPRFLGSLLLAVTLAFSAGEAAPLKSNNGPEDLSSKGIVILSVSQSPGTRAGAVFYLKEPHHPLRRLTPYIGEIFGKMDFSNPPGALWALELAPGTYQIDRWGVMYNTGLGEGEFEPRQCPPLTFSVQTGEIVYLGNLHMETFMVRNTFGLKVLGKGYPTFHDERKRDLARFGQKFPRFAGHEPKVRLLDFSAWKPFAEVNETR